MQKMKPLKRKVSLTLDEDVLERLRLLAEQNDRSLSQYINIILKAHLRSVDQRASHTQ